MVFLSEIQVTGLKESRAVWGIGKTGAAGPTGNRYGDPPGHTCIGVSGPVCRTATLKTERNDRVDNMAAFAAAALELLQNWVEEAAPAS